MQLQDGQYFYVYYWYDGKSLKDNEIKNINCEKIGKQLVEIHNITLKEENWIEDTKNINWEVLYYANNGRLEWLEYNIKRALMLETDSLEEQQLGISEVRETIEHIVYYDLVKEKIISNC